MEAPVLRQALHLRAAQLRAPGGGLGEGGGRVAVIACVHSLLKADYRTEGVASASAGPGSRLLEGHFEPSAAAEGERGKKEEQEVVRHAAPGANCYDHQR